MRKLFFILFILFLVGLAGYVYINRVLLPVQLKEFVINKAKEQLKRELSFTNIQFDLIRGVTVDDLVIYEKSSTTEPFVKVKQLQLNLDLAAILKDKKFTIPSIILREPFIHLVHLQDGSWNFSDILAPREGEQKTKAPLFLGSIGMNKGQVELTDLTASAETTDIFHDIDLKIRLSLIKGIEFELQTLPAEPNSFVKVNGYFQPLDKELHVDTQLKNLDFTKHALVLSFLPGIQMDESFIYTADLTVVVKNATLGLRGNLEAQTKLAGNFGQPFGFDGKIVANKFVLQRSADRTDLNGSFNFDIHSAYLGEDKGLKGSFVLQDLILKNTPQGWDIKLTSADLKNAALQLSSDRVIAGNFTLQQIYFNSRESNLLANGQLTATDAAIQLNPETVLKGNWLFKNFSLVRENGKLQAAAIVESSPLEINAANNFKLSGNLTTDRVEVTQKEDTIYIKTNLKISEASGTVSKTQFQGTLNVNNLLATLTGDKWHVHGQAATENLSADIEKKKFTGDPQVEFDVAFDAQDKSLIYSGTALLKSSALNGLPQVSEIKNINGKIEFANDQLKTDDLSVNALGTDIQIAGRLQNFKTPLVDIKADAQGIDLATIKPFFAEKLDELKIDPQGQANISLLFKGSLDDVQKAQITATADIIDASLESEKLPKPIKNITGKIKYSADSLQWEKLQLTYLGEEYTLSGSLSNFQKPSINNKLKSQQWDVSVWAKIDQDVIHVDSLKGEYLKTPFEAQGSIYLKEGHSPDVDIKAKGDIDLTDLARLIPSITDQLEKIKPAGTASLNLSFRGNVQDWQKGIINVEAQSTKINLYNLAFENVNLKYDQGRQDSDGLHLTATCYGGSLQVSGPLAFNQEGFPVSLSAHLENLDLALLRKGLKLKEQDLSGMLVVKLNLEGPLAQQRELKGNGSVDITDGSIWQFNLLKGLWKALLVPELENVVFTEGHAGFDIANKKISTKNLTLFGNIVDLNADGWIDFDQNVYFNVSPNFKEAAILSSGSSIKKGPSAILAHAQGYITIKVAGTLSKPTYQVNTSPGKILEKTTGNILEGVGGILEDILQHN